jgi:glycosyltransferase involved in cell wall biosynthesis
MHIAHLTSVHQRNDTRIFLKQCRSLARQYQISMVVADGLGQEDKDGIHIIDVGLPCSRINRIFKATWRVMRQARYLDADVYHIHDPELLPVAWWLKKSGRRVIYDAHEDVPRQILSKPWIPAGLRRGVSIIFEKFENTIAERMDAVVGATPYITQRFAPTAKITINVNNYPHQLKISCATSECKRAVCYTGSITRIRGIRELVGAMALLPGIKLILCGSLEDKSLERELSSHPGWKQVEYLGVVSRESVYEVMLRSDAGLVTYLPAPNHSAAQPTKMFEYMAAGLPVIASDFPLWKSILGKNDCGVCVDPASPRAIADAITFLLDHPQERARMGENGQRAVKNVFNWDTEAQVLCDFYQQYDQKKTYQEFSR